MENLTQEQINLYKSLFKGREDVFALRWEKEKKIGYSPAYSYDPYLYKIHKMKGGSFQNYTEKTHQALDNIQIANHLNGKQFVGIYPLLQNNTSWFIAADFDEKNWINDCRLFITECKKNKIPCYLERSRSGNGGHVWIFFNKPFPAYKARKILLKLLESSNVVSIFDKNASFDRMFPNQDYLSGKGIGNLIALPLNQTISSQGNNCFIDPDTLQKYDDQWGFLKKIERIDIQYLEDIYTSLFNEAANENVSPTKLTISLSNDVKISREGLTPALTEFLRESLNFPNTEFIIRKNSGKSTFGLPRYFRFIRENASGFSAPKGFIGKLIRFCLEQKIDYDLKDLRTLRPEIIFSFYPKLREYQFPVIAAAEKKNIGIIVAPPATGKTVMGLKIIASKQQPALILVHRKQLADQWAERIETFLGIQKQDIGTIGQGKRKIGTHVTIAMIQSLVKELKGENAVKIKSSFGTIIVDECHHIAAETFSDTIGQLNSYYLYGLTATPFRKNDNGNLISVHLGEIISEIESSSIKNEQSPEIIIRNTALDVPYNAKTDRFETLSNILIHDSLRNNLIIEDITLQIGRGKKVIILTERKEHIETLHQQLKRNFEVITLSGDDSEANRKMKWGALNSGNYQALITTGQFFGEGSDLSNAQCLFLVYPFSFEGKLVQYIGRVQRSEIKPIIYDYRDIKIEYLNRMFLKRNVYYRKLEKTLTLFDDFDEQKESLKSQQESIIEKSINIPIEKLDFLYGAVAFDISVKDYGSEINFDIENLTIRPEFDVLKPYFEKFLKSKSVRAEISLVLRSGDIIAKSARSDDINKLSREIIEAARFRYVENTLFKRNSGYKIDTTQNGGAISEGNNLPYESGEELLNDVLNKGNYRHQRQLRYLAEFHATHILKVRFVLSPFAFLFLLDGKDHFHMIMETLDSEEATYIWRINKSVGDLKIELERINEYVRVIRNQGRLAYLTSAPSNFSRILHDYSDERKGFVIWKDTLEEQII
ncbi:TOTE conflict system archaeo-eukaryotic primase domain-containing protein [Pedobacter sp. WC2501]|uniref:TOTE conflict system archaeo-eukaryotic primase domain-containing protein n=1 Tax=Pedobacter sp. WC2501 TaxID=3461400 RepID=UPI0040459438